MKSYFSKIFAVGAIALLAPVLVSADTISDLQAQIAALQAQLARLTGAQVAMTSTGASCGFTQELSLGVSSPEVFELQRVLNESPDTQVASYGAGAPGNETDFFGFATQQAVIRFQNKYANEILFPMGMVRGSGIVGLATRAKLNTLCGQTGGVVLGASTDVPSNTSVVVQPSNTNSNQSGVTYVPGSSNNGTVTNNNTQLYGTAGSINVTNTTANTDNQVRQGMESNVMSFRVNAQGSDVAITNLRLQLQNIDQTGQSATRLERYADHVAIYMNGSQIATENIGDFSRDSNVYTISIPLNNATVRMGSGNQSTFTVALRGAPVIDSADVNTNNWQVSVSDIRYRDATGATLVDGYYGQRSGINFVKLSSSGYVTLQISTDSSNPQAQSVHVNTSSDTKNIPILAFRLTAQGSPITFNNVTFNPQFSGTLNLSDMVDEFLLMHNGQQIGELNPTANGYQTIYLDSDYTLQQGNSDVFTIVASVRRIAQTSGQANIFDQGDSLTANLVSVNPTDMNGDNVSSGNVSGSAYGNQQSFYSSGLQTSGFSSSVMQSGGVSNGYTIIPGQTFTMTYHLHAFGNTYYIPKTLVANQAVGTAGLAFNVLSGGQQMSPNQVSIVMGSLSSTANTVGNYFVINDGEDQSFTTTVTLNPNTGAQAQAGMYSLQLSQVGYTDNSMNSGATMSYNFAPLQNYQTNQVYVAKY